MAGMFPSKVISGGQTGVDRAALDISMELGLPCGGWCPRGRKAEDGPIDLRYPLKETKSDQYQFRTEANVMEADGTLVLTIGKPPGGTSFTIQMALKHKKPHFVIDLNRKVDRQTVRDWAAKHKIRVLNVAGPSESKIPGIHEKAKKYLGLVFADKEWSEVDGRKT